MAQWLRPEFEFQHLRKKMSEATLSVPQAMQGRGEGRGRGRPMGLLAASLAATVSCRFTESSCPK